MNRRHFFISVAGVLSFGLINSVVNAEERRRARPAAGGDAKAGALPMVDPKDPQAQVMNYVEKHADLKKAELKVDRQGVKFDAQHCANCSFYKSTDAKTGACTLFPNKLVKADAWCSTWNKKV